MSVENRECDESQFTTEDEHLLISKVNWRVYGNLSTSWAPNGRHESNPLKWDQTQVGLYVQ